MPESFESGWFGLRPICALFISRAGYAFTLFIEFMLTLRADYLRVGCYCESFLFAVYYSY